MFGLRGNDRGTLKVKPSKGSLPCSAAPSVFAPEAVLGPLSSSEALDHELQSARACAMKGRISEDLCPFFEFGIVVPSWGFRV